MNCPNKHKSAHPKEVQANRRGECTQCGTRLMRNPVRRHSFSSNAQRINATVIEYEGGYRD